MCRWPRACARPDEAALIFDKPQGRIVEMAAIADNEKGQISRAAVEAFYRASLPNLGWRLHARKSRKAIA